MARRFTQPFMYDFIGRSNRALRGSTETPKNRDTAQSFQRTLQVGHCLIASGPADLSVGFCTVAIVTPPRTSRMVWPVSPRRGVCPGRRTMRAVIDGIIQSSCGSVDPGRCSPMRS